MATTELDSLAKEVQLHLQWPSLLARYQEADEYWRSQRARYQQPDEFWRSCFQSFSFYRLAARNVANWREISAIAGSLSNVPAIADRIDQLKQFGLMAELHSFEESGHSSLTLTVKFNERGRTALEEG